VCIPNWPIWFINWDIITPIDNLNIGWVAVTSLLFVSGAVLMLNYEKINSLAEAGSFYLKRFSRIYPAYWIALTIGLIMVPANLSSGLIQQFSGFDAFLGNWGGAIDGVGWFIGLIAVLYILFPVLAKAIKRRPHLTMLALLIIELGSLAIVSMFFKGGVSAEYWFPGCRIFEFGLGIYIVQMNLYPKTITRSSVIVFFSELSFYVFLIHIMFLNLWYTVSPEFYLVAILLLSAMVMALDEKIQQLLKTFTGSILFSGR
jgi:peptidoglycan/LPS O-acetylase OafA/YrhL